MTERKQRLIELVKSKALKFGDFVLASGKTAKYYLDCRKLTLDAEGANVIGESILELIDQFKPDAVGGMAIGADPITAAVITLAWQKGMSINGFIVRKEAKEHGTGRSIEGPVVAGQTAVIVEDVTTSGGSSLKAIERAQDFGLSIVAVVSIVDRKSGAKELFQQHNIPFYSLLTIDDLGIETT
jgi:orotate phosphoribosyltransferase